MKNSAHEGYVEAEHGRYGGCHYPAVDIAERICGRTCVWFVGHAAQPAIQEVVDFYTHFLDAARRGDASARTFVMESDPATLVNESTTGGPAWRLARNRISQELGMCGIASGAGARALAETILREAATDGVERRFADYAEAWSHEDISVTAH